MKNLQKYFIGAALGASVVLGASAPAQAQLLNGGFDSSFAHWNIINPAPGHSDASAFITNTRVKTGPHAAGLYADSTVGGAFAGNGNPNTPSPIRLEQKILTNPGDKYQIQGWRLNNRGDGGNLFEVRFDGQLVFQTSVNGTFNAVAFKSFSGTAVAKGGSASLVFTVMHPTGTYVLDDVSVTDLSPTAGVPEVDPRAGAAPVALALGSLMLMADRRRAKKSAIA